MFNGWFESDNEKKKVLEEKKKYYYKLLEEVTIIAEQLGRLDELDDFEYEYNKDPDVEERMLDFCIESLESIISFQNLPVHIVFEPLTVSLLVKSYWNPIKKKLKKKLKISMVQDPNSLLGPLDLEVYTSEYIEDVELYFNAEFIPNGDLEKYFMDGRTTIIKDWLSTEKALTGPYSEAENYKHSNKFYALPGSLSYSDDNFEESGLQICNGPINTLSNNCISGPVYVFGGFISTKTGKKVSAKEAKKLMDGV